VASAPVQQADVVIHGEGPGTTVYLLVPLTARARKWVAQYVHFEPYQRQGMGIAVEHRYLGQIVEAMQAAGLEVR
jgi:hypothetical protein